MLIIRRVNATSFPSGKHLIRIGDTSPYYHLIVDRVDNLDTFWKY